MSVATSSSSRLPSPLSTSSSSLLPLRLYVYSLYRSRFGSSSLQPAVSMKLRPGKPTKTKRRDVAPWSAEVRCGNCGVDGQSCLNNYGGHETWCFRSQGWVSTKAYWYCPGCRAKVESKGWIRTRTLGDTLDIEEHCRCEFGAHAPRGPHHVRCGSSVVRCGSSLPRRQGVALYCNLRT